MCMCDDARTMTHAGTTTGRPLTTTTTTTTTGTKEREKRDTTKDDIAAKERRPFFVSRFIPVFR
ncbi:hypothetical protein psal_cds_1418 [Pandoravirus salinus]|uniref:Uncharacterized protein n=1 Tax=Pandoravirus salinus TaxID=1349410 RepID=S4W213_9VIRU|nr:hypothetical protein psal_cds_1418 [Pandoravirus salinus]AGO85856.1 hypothetical protein psal_cds_1418 [Pandoravirus salinus]